MTDAAESTAKWRELAAKFQSLADALGGSKLKAYTVRGENELQDVGQWSVDGYDPLNERFKVHAVEAARDLGGVPKETSLLNAWLHRLYQYVCDESSPHKSSYPRTTKNGDGTEVRVECPGINEVCKASADFCLSLQRRALEGERTRETPAQRFQAWIVGNSSALEPMYGKSKYPVREWISSVARCATTPIPIDFLSDRLNVLRLPRRPSERPAANGSATEGVTMASSDGEAPEISTAEATGLPEGPEFGPLHAFLNHVASPEGLMWCITEHGLWMALEPPKDGVYTDSNGIQHEAAKELAKPRRNEAKVRFDEFAGPLWRNLRQRLGRKKASIDDLLGIAPQLDSEGFLPPGDYLEGKDAVKRLTDYNSRNPPIDTWVKLVEHPSFVSAVRRTLARASSVC